MNAIKSRSNASGLGLTDEQLRVLERYHLDFVRSGAALSADERLRFADITERLSVLGTQFGQNVLNDERDSVFALTEAEVAGLSESAKAAAAGTMPLALHRIGPSSSLTSFSAPVLGSGSRGPTSSSGTRPHAVT